MAHADADAIHQLGIDWRAIQATATTRVLVQRVHSTSRSWKLWLEFCADLRVDLNVLPDDPIPLLQVFAQRLRSGTIAAGRRPLRTRTVEDTVRSVGQTYASVGSPDPRMNVRGALDFRLTSLYQAWAKVDDPPSRVKPLPLTLLTHVVNLAGRDQRPFASVVSECLVFGFYFLLRPGEYLGIPNNELDTLFRLKDLQFWIGARALDTFTCPISDLQAATFATVTFTRQKNGVRNETIGHGRSGHAQLCPVLALVARAIALRQAAAPPNTPLNAYHTADNTFRFVLPADVTRYLRAALALYPDPSYPASAISARSTRAGGAMALLCAGIDSDRIGLIGRWRSDKLYRYLHVQAQPVMTGISAAMLRGGSFRLAPG